MIYGALSLVEMVFTVVLAKHTLSLYRLLQCRERLSNRINLTRFSYRKEVILRPLRETEAMNSMTLNKLKEYMDERGST